MTMTRWLPRPLQAAALVFGLWLFGAGEAMLVAASLGNSPWTVFSQGIASRAHLSIGLMTNLIGAAVLVLWIPLRQRPGLGNNRRFYLRCGLGPGPRDGLMTGIARISGWPLGAARAAVEVTVLFVGWLLGGVAGIGTLLFAVLIGPGVHAAVRLLSRLPDDQL
jgi:uncharacterized membrane protein YczE